MRVIDGLRWSGCHGVTVSHQTCVWSWRYVLHMAVLASPASHDRVKTKNWHSHLPSLHIAHTTPASGLEPHTHLHLKGLFFLLNILSSTQNTSHSRSKLTCKCHFLLTIKFKYRCWVHTCYCMFSISRLHTLLTNASPTRSSECLLVCLRLRALHVSSSCPVSWRISATAL